MASAKYGSLELKGKVSPQQSMEEKEDDQTKSSKSNSFMEDFNPTDPEFWDKVHNKHCEEKKRKNGLSWFECLDEIRADRIFKKYDSFDTETEEGDDVIVLMMTQWFDELEKDETMPFGSGPQAFASYERQIAKIARIIINREYDKVKDPADCRYAKRIVEHNGVRKTLLHVAAEGFLQKQLTPTKVACQRNFTEIAKCLLKRDPDLVYLTTHPKKRQLAVELALENFDDDMASLLIDATMQKSRIRLLFEYDEERKKLPPFQFKNYIESHHMKKSVIAVLDSLINPDWPMLPADQEIAYEKEWHRVPDIPLRYHFFYRILDGDDYGRSPWHDGFSHRSNSCLQAICQSDHNKAAIQHPVIRQLADTKWSAYGKSKIIMYSMRYMMFLAVMSVALLGAVQSKDPLKYKTSFDIFRLVCEILTLIFVGIYFFIEIDQLEKERMKYIHDPFNWLDTIGLLSLISIVPLRFVQVKAQWYLATIAYIVNFLRIFKFFPAVQQLGLYSKILYGLMVKELRVFAVVYIVILFAFSGGTYLCLRATTTYNAVTGFSAVSVTGFADILLRGVRALAEGNPFADSYDSFNAFVIIIILTSMMLIIVFLVNILIAQLSTCYEAQVENALLEFDLDKALFVTRLENSRFRSWNMRMQNFKDGEFVNDSERIKELLKGWEVLHPDAKKNEARQMFH